MTARGITVVREHLAKHPAPADRAERRAQYDRAERVFKTPADVRVEAVQAGGVPSEWLVPPGARTDAAVLYLHGGGYVIGSPRSHRHVAAAVAAAAGISSLLAASRGRLRGQSPVRYRNCGSWRGVPHRRCAAAPRAGCSCNVVRQPAPPVARNPLARAVRAKRARRVHVPSDQHLR